MRPVVAICQPHYIPWIGYFEMIDRVDVFVLLDDVDYIQREWKNRNRIRADRRSAGTKWLSVPIERASRRGTPIAQTRISASDWRQDHVEGFRHVYRSAPHFEDALALLRCGLEAPAESLGALNERILRETCLYLGIHRRMERSSDLAQPGRKTEKLLNLCQELGAAAYLANDGSAGYLELERFREAGIECEFQDYTHPEYEQWDGGQRMPFLSHLSILDLIANHGPESLRILRAGRPTHV